jgi:hypothetical protein
MTDLGVEKMLVSSPSAGVSFKPFQDKRWSDLAERLTDKEKELTDWHVRFGWDDLGIWLDAAAA